MEKVFLGRCKSRMGVGQTKAAFAKFYSLFWTWKHNTGPLKSAPVILLAETQDV